MAKDFQLDLTKEQRTEILQLRKNMRNKVDGTAWSTAEYDELRKLMLAATELRIDTVRFSADALETRLALVTGDESRQVQLTTHNTAVYGPSAKFDGTLVAYAVEITTGYRIWTIDWNGNNSQLIDTSFNAHTPSWSPDGSKLSFVGDVEASYTGTLRGDGNINLMNPDGTGRQNLAMTPGQGNMNGFGVAAKYSPDGEWIIFMSDRHRSGDNNWFNIFKIRPNGTEETQLTFGSNFSVGNYREYRYPVFTPDGQYILFDGTTYDKIYHVWIMNADGTNIRRITTATGHNLTPMPSPYGSRISFISNREGQYDLYTCDYNGDNVVRLTQNPAEDRRPVYSKNGSDLIFPSLRSGTYELWKMPSTGVPSYPEFRHEYYMRQDVKYFEAWAYEHIPSYAYRVNLELVELAYRDHPYREADPAIVDRSLLRHGFRERRLGELDPPDVLQLTEPLPDLPALYPSDTLYPSNTLYPSE